MSKKILVVDDDPELRKLLQTYLGRAGYDVLLLPDPQNLLPTLERFAPQLVVLDVMMPGEDGLAALRRLRAAGDSTPVVMLTARDETVDRIVGLEMGADDYLGKPFEPRELLARIEAVLRRPPLQRFEGSAKPFAFGPFVCDLERRELLRDGRPVDLTTHEFELLATFIRHANKPLKRDRLLALTSPESTEAFDRAIDVRVHRLRRAIEDDPSKPRYIQTVWGLGYVFVPDGAAPPGAA